MCLLKNVNIYNEPNVNAKNNYKLIKYNADDERKVMCGRQSATHLLAYLARLSMRRTKQCSAAQSVVALMNCPQMKKARQELLTRQLLGQKVGQKVGQKEIQRSAFNKYHTHIQTLYTHAIKHTLHIFTFYCLLFVVFVR